MRGRHAIGPEIADRVTDVPEAARRLHTILETIAGTKPVRAACRELGICEQLFERLRTRAMHAAAAALVLRPSGRKRRAVPPAAAEIADLKRRVAELEAELRTAEVRAELAAAWPRPAGKKP
jgi:hypothetical protein